MIQKIIVKSCQSAFSFVLAVVSLFSSKKHEKLSKDMCQER